MPGRGVSVQGPIAPAVALRSTRLNPDAAREAAAAALRIAAGGGLLVAVVIVVIAAGSAGVFGAFGSLFAGSGHSLQVAEAGGTAEAVVASPTAAERSAA